MAISFLHFFFYVCFLPFCATAEEIFIEHHEVEPQSIIQVLEY